MLFRYLHHNGYLYHRKELGDQIIADQRWAEASRLRIDPSMSSVLPDEDPALIEFESAAAEAARAAVED